MEGAGTCSLFPLQYLNAMSREIRVFLQLSGTDGVAGLHTLPRSMLCLSVIAVIFLFLLGMRLMVLEDEVCFARKAIWRIKQPRTP